MTAMNIVKRHDEIILITDGAGYAQDGTLLCAASKVDLLPHFSAFVMQSGGSAWTPAIIAMFGFIATDTDDLFDKAAGLLGDIQDKYAGISAEPLGRVLFGGWSNNRQQMRLGCVYSEEASNLQQDGNGSEVILPEAYTLQEFEGDQLLTQPAISAQLWIDAMGGPIYDLKQIVDVDDFASNLLAAQRTIGMPHRGVGAFGQITKITQAESTVRIFERYEDKLGDVMTPLSFDWKARRAKRAIKAAGGIPEGLSPLKRAMAEKKARKGTLRAVR
jgi:hypothetical protein